MKNIFSIDISIYRLPCWVSRLFIKTRPLSCWIVSLVPICACHTSVQLWDCSTRFLLLLTTTFSPCNAPLRTGFTWPSLKSSTGLTELSALNKSLDFTPLCNCCSPQCGSHMVEIGLAHVTALFRLEYTWSMWLSPPSSGVLKMSGSFGRTNEAETEGRRSGNWTKFTPLFFRSFCFVNLQLLQWLP